MSEQKETTVDDFKFDSANARKHGDKNKKVIENSLKQFGAGRSILVDADGVIRAGNGTAEAWKQSGGKIRVVESDGKELIVVKRTDLRGAEAMAYAIADNRASELADWDDSVLASQLDLLDGQFDLSQIGFNEDDIEYYTGFDVEETEDLPDLPDGEKKPFQQMAFVLHDDQVEVVKEAIKKAKGLGHFDSLNENSNGNALARIAEDYCG